MPIIHVKDDKVHERTINSQNGQKIIREQRASLDLGDGYEQPFRVSLGTGPVYPVGDYDLHPESFGPGQYGDLQLSRFVKLRPLGRPTAKS